VAKTLTTVDRLALERVKSTILDIQRYSLDDGPRLRTNIFLKGARFAAVGAATRNHKRRSPSSDTKTP
jgi:hypothetical protein